MNTARLPTYFITHGGGPWPYLEGDARHDFDKLEQSLIAMRQELGDRPRAVLVISGHWEEPGFAIASGARPGMVYDYVGLPEHLYQIQYRAPGAPELARRVHEMLKGGGLAARLDPTRGFDHGTVSIMKPLYPDADIPIVQLSLDASLDPALHLKAGRQLTPLRDEGVLIIGSGLTYHNVREMRGPRCAAASKAFDAWLQQTILDSPPDHRAQQLIAWEKAPRARAAHPRADHLLPLMVVAGAADQDRAVCTFHQTDFMGSLTVSSFRFGEMPGARARAAPRSDTSKFVTIFYCKENCPLCLQVRLFLLEAGLLDKVEIREFARGSAQEQAIRAELAAHLDRVSFPAAQIAPGRYITESDAIIAYLAAQTGRDPAHMPVLRAYREAALKPVLRLRQESPTPRAKPA
jgi:aromatic ring-opening dioxygenase catalytic subunit (LigB family)